MARLSLWPNFMPLPDLLLSPEEAARVLSIPPDADAPSAAALEEYLRDGLMRLYQVVAERRVAAAAPVETAEPEEIAQPFEDNHADAPRPHAEHRRAPRFEAHATLTGTYRDANFSVLEISATGLRIRHEETFRAGDEARLTLTLQNPSPRQYTFRARVAWTTIAQRGSGPSYCVSGLQITANLDHLQRVVEHLRNVDDGRKRTTPNRTPAALVGLTDDDVASIIRAYRRFTSDPVEAARWYSRARFSLVDEHVRSVAPERARDREEVLGIWEFLERKVAVEAVINVVSWLRRTRSAAAV
ncbi:MAG TPA: PilZ domain-containing protein [Thermoanaerobaculia bacterium]|nr:PilZ domain-containing protein [Thermoanaerobaculia bacterium]